MHRLHVVSTLYLFQCNFSQCEQRARFWPPHQAGGGSIAGRCTSFPAGQGPNTEDFSLRITDGGADFPHLRGIGVLLRPSTDLGSRGLASPQPGARHTWHRDEDLAGVTAAEPLGAGSERLAPCHS